MQAQIETIVAQPQTWQAWTDRKDRLLVPLLVVGGLLTAVWNLALLAITLRACITLTDKLLS